MSPLIYIYPNKKMGICPHPMLFRLLDRFFSVIIIFIRIIHPTSIFAIIILHQFFFYSKLSLVSLPLLTRPPRQLPRYHHFPNSPLRLACSNSDNSRSYSQLSVRSPYRQLNNGEQLLSPTRRKMNSDTRPIPPVGIIT